MDAQIGIFFFCFVMVSSAAEEEKKNLTAVVGGNITLDHPVREKGFLSFGRNAIAGVDKGSLDIYDNDYRSNLLWNRTSGLLTISNLQRNNSGVYIVQSVKPPGSSSYLLTVYDPVETPAVDGLNVDSDSCLLLCLLDKETTLLWYKDGQVVNRSSSASSLTLTVHKQDVNSSFRCVAVGPAEEKALPVHLDTLCWTHSTQDPPGLGFLLLVLVLGCVCGAVVSMATVKRLGETGTSPAADVTSYVVFTKTSGGRGAPAP